MGMLFRHTLRSIGKNKLQAALISVTIIIVTVILFAAFSISDVFYNVAANEYSRFGVDADIMVGNVSGGETYARGTITNLLDGDDNVEYIRSFLKSGTVLRSDSGNYTVLVEATELQGFVTTDNGFHLLSQAERGGYPRALISQRFADEFAVKAGDLIQVLSPISQQYISFRVTQIFKNEGFFSGTTVQNVLVDIADVGSLGLCNTTLIKLKDPSELQTYMDKIAEVLPAIAVGSAYPEQLITDNVKQNTALFSAAIAFVVILMLLILLTNYIIIARNRTNEMALFKAAGATPLETAGAILSEAAVYGTVGAAIGTIIGRLVIGGLISAFIPYAAAAITYPVWKYLATFILGALAGIIAAVAPAVNISGKSVRELTEKGEKHTRYAPLWMILLAAVAVTAFLLAMLLAPSKYLLYLFLGSAPFLVLFILTLTPYFVRGMAFIGKKLVKSGSPKIALFAAKRNASLSSIAALIAVVIAFSFLFTSVIDVVVKGITPYYTRMSADTVITVPATTADNIDSQAALFSGIDGVDSVVPYTSTATFFILNGEKTEWEIIVFGVQNSGQIPSITTSVDEVDLQTFDAASHPIVFNYDMAKRAGISLGDSIQLYTVEHTSTDTLSTVYDTTFTVVAFEYTEKEWNYTGIIRAADFRLDGEQVELGLNFLINYTEDADPNATYAKIRTAAERQDNFYIVLPYDVWAYSGAQGVAGVATLIKVIEALFILVAVLGVLNVIIVAVLDRARELYLYKIYGMSLSDYYLFSAAEGAVVSLAGGAVGFTVGLVFAQVIPALSALIDKYFLSYALPWQLFAAVAIGIAVFIILWISVSRSNKTRYLEKRYGTERR